MTGLTASAGIACNKLLAKIACNEKKPNNQFFLEPDPVIIKRYMKYKFVKDIPGIGPILGKVLNGLDIIICGEILRNKLKLF